MRTVDEDDRPAVAVQALVDSGDELFGARRYEEALACYAEVVERFGAAHTDGIADHVLTALARTGAVHLARDRLDEAEAAFQTVLRHVEGASSSGRKLRPALKMIVEVFRREVRARVEAERFVGAIAASDVLVRLLGQDLPDDCLTVVVEAQSLRALALERSGRVEGALAVLVEVVECYRGVGEREVRISVVDALHDHAKLLEDRREYQRAIEVYDEMLGLVETVQPPLLKSLRVALRNKVYLLCLAERYEEALAVEDQIIERCSGEPPLPGEHVALKALSGKAWILKKLGRVPESITACEELVRTYGEQSESTVMGEVAYALVTKAVLLRDERRYEEVIAVVDELLERFGEVEEPSVREKVADGLAQKGFALGRLGRWEDAVVLDEQMIERFSFVQDDPELAETVSRVMDHRAYSLEQLGRVDDAVAAWGALLERGRDTGSPVPSDSVDDALLKRAKLLLMMGRGEDAAAAADELISRVGDDPDQLPRHLEALGAKSVALMMLERYDEAINVLDEIAERGRGLNTQAVRKEVVFALVNKAMLLWGLDRFEEWERMPAEMDARLGEGGLHAFAEVIDEVIDTPSAQPALAAARYYRAELLLERGRRDDALAALTDLIERFEDNDEESIEATVDLARDLQERLISESDERD